MTRNWPARPNALIWAAIWLVLFVLLAGAVNTGAAASTDSTLRQWIHGFAEPGVTAAFILVTHLGSVLVVSIVTISGAAALWLTGQRVSAGFLALAMAGAAVLDNSLKFGFRRLRPDPFFALDTPASYSFPSGHSLFSTCLFGALAIIFASRVRNGTIHMAMWASTALLILAIGLSRIYLGVHYPTDVAGGYLAGLFWLACSIWLMPQTEVQMPPPRQLKQS